MMSDGVSVGVCNHQRCTLPLTWNSRTILNGFVRKVKCPNTACPSDPRERLVTGHHRRCFDSVQTVASPCRSPENDWPTPALCPNTDELSARWRFPFPIKWCHLFLRHSLLGGSYGFRLDKVIRSVVFAWLNPNKLAVEASCPREYSHLWVPRVTVPRTQKLPPPSPSLMLLGAQE